MIKEKGLFSNRYLTRKGKENTHHGNQEVDFPLAFTSNKCHRDKTPPSAISARRRKQEKKTEERPQLQQTKPESKSQNEQKLQKQLRQAREQIKRINKDHHTKQSKQEQKMKEIEGQLQRKTKRISQIQQQLTRQTKKNKQSGSNSKRYGQTIKQHIYWLLKIYSSIDNSQLTIRDIKKQVEQHYKEYLSYIDQFGIQRQLQEIVQSIQSRSISQGAGESVWNHQISHQLSRINMNSIFTQEGQDNNIVRIMQTQPLIETFNNNQPQLIQSESKITKKLFSDSPLFKQKDLRIKTNISINEDSLNISQDDHNQFLDKGVQNIVLPKQVQVLNDFMPQQGEQSYIVLNKGQTVKLLRKIREGLWIGQNCEKIGLVNQSNIKL